MCCTKRYWCSECRPLYDFRFTKCTNAMIEKFSENIDNDVWYGWQANNAKIRTSLNYVLLKIKSIP